MSKTKVIILIGPPCSGKSTWARKFLKENSEYIRINRDEIRTMLNGRYIIKPDLERLITKISNEMIIHAGNAGKNVILDNTHCKAGYIQDIINNHKECVYTLRFFSEPLWKLKFRNIVRYVKTGIWIPTKVIEDMNRNVLNLGVNLAKNLSSQIPYIEKVER